MKMKKPINFFLFLLAFVLVSCQKNDDVKAISTTQEISLYEKLTAANTNVEGTIAFKSIGNISKGNPEQIDIDGIFKDKTGKTLKTETLQVAQFDVEEKANSSLAYYKFFNNLSSNFKSIVSNFYENQVKVVVKSKEFGDVSTSLYSPSVVQIELPATVKNTLKLNRNQGLTIKWTSDAKLGVGNEGEQQVGASIVYHTEYLKNVGKTNLPTDNITVYKLANDLTGEINFTADDLAALPLGGEVHIFLARANQNTATSSAGKKISIISFSMSYLQDVIVQ